MLTHRIIFASMLLILSACASATLGNGTDTALNEEPDPRQGEEVRQICFARSIDNFQLATRRSVVVQEGNDFFLIETYNRCLDLEDALAVGIAAQGSCLGRGDRIIPSDNVFGRNNFGVPSAPCIVRSIYKWDPDGLSEPETDQTDS